jgi:hypothetical protein
MAISQGLPEREFKPQAVAARVAQEVAELPDRTSPEDWPEAMLVTEMELSSIVESAVRDYCFKAVPPPDSAPTSGETRVTEEVGPRVIEGYDMLDGSLALTVAWPDGSETLERVSVKLDDWLSTRWDYSDRPHDGRPATPATGVDRAGVWEEAARVADAMPGWAQPRDVAVQLRLRALHPTAAAKPQSEGER